MAKTKRTGFTLIELLTVVAIISLLIGILVPTVQRAQRKARETAVRAQLDGIAKGIEMFNSDTGYYPNSQYQDYESGDEAVCGAHRMTMAMIGRDKAGCPMRNGDDVNAVYYYDANDNKTKNTTYSQWGTSTTTKAPRRGLYIDPNGFYIPYDNTTGDMEYMPLLCDKFARQQTDTIDSATGFPGRNVILYYKARPARSDADNVSDIYTVDDNWRITGWGAGTGHNDPKKNDHFYWGVHGTANNPIGGIVNMSARVGDVRPPYNKESYLLISAGFDGEYFTDDDVVNWNKQ